MSYRAGVCGASNPRVVCDGVDCENYVMFASDNVKPRCLVRGTPPGEGWETTVYDGKRYDHCPDCVAEDPRAQRRQPKEGTK